MIATITHPQVLSPLSYSAQALAMTKGYEGLRTQSYQDIIGVWSIGYGHTGPGIGPGQHISEATAEAYLLADLAGPEHFINNTCTVVLTQGQFDALVDFAFNCGLHNLATSTLWKLVNEGNFAAAREEFIKWDHAGHREVEALKHRRIKEAVTFSLSASIDEAYDADFERWCDEQDERYRLELGMFDRTEDESIEGLIHQLEEQG